MAWWVLGVCLLIGAALVRGARAARSAVAAPPRPSAPLCVSMLLGSGGHTMEMLALARALPRDEYAPRVYLVSSGDPHSVAKAHAAEGGALDPHPLQALEIPRARRVGQSFWTAPWSVLLSFCVCVRAMLCAPRREQRAWADLLLLNGPATCVPLVVAVWCARVRRGLTQALGRPTPRMIYVESVARVTSLSLTAKLLRPLVDQFVVQWPAADSSASCHGLLV